MIIYQAIGKTGLRLKSDPMSMRRSHQITSGMSLLRGYDVGQMSLVPKLFMSHVASENLRNIPWVWMGSPHVACRVAYKKW